MGQSLSDPHELPDDASRNSYDSNRLAILKSHLGSTYDVPKTMAIADN